MASAVARLWANYVQSGRKQLEEVPQKYLAEVKKLLGME